MKEAEYFTYHEGKTYIIKYMLEPKKTISFVGSYPNKSLFWPPFSYQYIIIIIIFTSITKFKIWFYGEIRD